MTGENPSDESLQRVVVWCKTAAGFDDLTPQQSSEHSFPPYSLWVDGSVDMNGILPLSGKGIVLCLFKWVFHLPNRVVPRKFCSLSSLSESCLAGWSVFCFSVFSYIFILKGHKPYETLFLHIGLSRFRLDGYLYAGQGLRLPRH